MTYDIALWPAGQISDMPAAHEFRRRLQEQPGRNAGASSKLVSLLRRLHESFDGGHGYWEGPADGDLTQLAADDFIVISLVPSRAVEVAEWLLQEAPLAGYVVYDPQCGSVISG